MHIIAFSPLINSFKQSDFFGKLIFFSLFILSILSWIIILYKFWLTKKARSSSVSFENILHNQKNNLLNLNFNHMDSNPFLEIFDSLKIHAIEILDKNRFFLQKQENNSSQNFLTDIDLQLVESHLISKISKEIQSFEKNLLEYPHYTKPLIYKNKKVPEILLSGNHKEITKWREEKSREKTKKFRPDLLK